MNFKAAILVENSKPPIFWKDKEIIIRQLKKWDLKKINKIIKKTFDLEVRLKSDSSINHHLLFKMLILDVCQQANAS